MVETSGRATEEGSLFQDGQTCNRCRVYRTDQHKECTVVHITKLCRERERETERETEGQTESQTERQRDRETYSNNRNDNSYSNINSNNNIVIILVRWCVC